MEEDNWGMAGVPMPAHLHSKRMRRRTAKKIIGRYLKYHNRKDLGCKFYRRLHHATVRLDAQIINVILNDKDEAFAQSRKYESNLVYGGRITKVYKYNKIKRHGKRRDNRDC